MITITQIIAAEDSLKLNFLRECLVEMRKNVQEEEIFEGKKFRTKVGPNKFHFDRVMKKTTDDLDIVYWVDEKRIFQYHAQLEKVFNKYLYIMNTKGV